jgi:hypothetical protein
MFECSIEQLAVSIWIDQREKDILDQYGFMSDFSAGNNRIDYQCAVSLINRYYDARPSVTYKTNLKRFDSAFRRIMYAFGPEFLERHEQQVI